MTDDRRRLWAQYDADPIAVNRMLVERYRATGGHLGPPFAGPERMLLLTTRGARSGRPRTVPVMYVRDGDRFVVFASNAGSRHHPGWYHNLVACPEATAEVGNRTLAVTAVVATGEERERLWRSFPFPEHQERSERPIPVIVLEPRPG
ncbi:MAG TPA: nitroreductase family deazaflavin-dependent oxidoreductase [Candidatus Dormibacteraeota bacterium]|nr:nitroreductase family deazaflavin-dependent oxidoreductase [Candidatus Dormibacteraeota bacterium]